MAGILVIERQPVLREALRQFLFPEHRTTVRDRWPGKEEVRGHDLVIVDRESIEDGGAEVPEVLRALRDLEVPAVWLHLGAAPVLDPEGPSATVSKPLEGALLEAALRSLLPAPSAAEGPSGDEPSDPGPEGDRPDPVRPSEGRGAPEDGGAEVIELTDVVDETDSGTPVSESGNRG